MTIDNLYCGSSPITFITKIIGNNLFILFSFSQGIDINSVIPDYNVFVRFFLHPIFIIDYNIIIPHNNSFSC